jgi:hypothetical protein
MYCTNCGTARVDNAGACANCGAPVQYFPPQAPVKNYLVPAVLSAFCCLPVAVVAIVFAAQVNTKVATGDLAGALVASRRAKMWSWIAIGGALVFWLGYMALMAIGVASSVR